MPKCLLSLLLLSVTFLSNAQIERGQVTEPLHAEDSLRYEIRFIDQTRIEAQIIGLHSDSITVLNRDSSTTIYPLSHITYARVMKHPNFLNHYYIGLGSPSVVHFGARIRLSTRSSLGVSVSTTFGFGLGYGIDYNYHFGRAFLDREIKPYFLRCGVSINETIDHYLLYQIERKKTNYLGLIHLGRDMYITGRVGASLGVGAAFSGDDERPVLGSYNFRIFAAL